MLSTFKSKVKPTIKRVLSSELTAKFASPIKGKASVLCYHRVTDQRYTGRGFLPNIYLCVRNDNFENQIRYISSKAASLTQIVENLDSTAKNDHQIGVSFDDGYKDNLEIALPILEKYEVPATIFIAPGLIDRSAPIWWEELGFIITNSRKFEFEWNGQLYNYKIEDDEAKCKAHIELNKLFKRLGLEDQSKILEILRSQCPVRFNDDILLSWGELEKISTHPLINIGCHTINHPVLRNENETSAYSEIKNSKLILSQKLKNVCNLLAYPVGGPEEAGEREFELAKKAEFKASFTTRRGHLFKQHSTHRHALPRLTIDYFESLDDFKWLLSGFSCIINNQGRRIITR